NYYRTYDPSTGRYLESDPIGLVAGLNTYAYVGNMPTMYVDPLGLFKIDNKICAAHALLCRQVDTFKDRITEAQREALKEVTGATDEQIDCALEPGMGPELTFAEIDKITSPANYRPLKELITMDYRKAGSNKWRNRYRFKDGGFDRILGHELAHHLDNVATGNADPTREEGNEWEELVYE
ncbi:MAG TPA: RHS repeat-associated core domain-containing protein, partial [Woeseiaceae bacterium]|nr:RHS repeat-associated core domain-containing protein [Woeseiaceae bacterium]